MSELVDALGLPMKSTKPKADEARKATQLPTPSGYRLLCAIPPKDDKFEGTSILKSDKDKQVEHLLSVVLFVLKVGPDAYKDTNKFPTGPWCKEGDFILVRPHAGTRVEIHGQEFRVINDDSVEAVVEDPRGIRRA